MNIAKYYKRWKGKTVSSTFATDLPHLRSVYDQLVQVMLNLILIALDATEEGAEDLKKLREGGTASSLAGLMVALETLDKAVHKSLLKAWLSEPEHTPMWPMHGVSDIEASRLYAMSCAETPALNALRKSVERRKKLLWLDSLDTYPYWESIENINKYKNGSK